MATVTSSTFPDFGPRRSKRMSKHGKDKVHKVLSEFKRGKLHSGSKKGPVVKSRKQAIAIALSEKRRMHNPQEPFGDNAAKASSDSTPIYRASGRLGKLS